MEHYKTGRPPKLTTSQVTELLTQRKNGRTFREISAYFGISRSTAWNYYQAHKPSTQEGLENKESNTVNTQEREIFSRSDKFTHEKESSLSGDYSHTKKFVAV